ncbi:RHS repeat-associated core domain-containing protein, partial [Streptomyces sp. NPDC058542]|uniref:RHS repeat-associated core domain-containing protein n=1 Tax=Streptomyces sp. NPDC058542 TaxID=3346543 RepID=UPI003654B245
AGVDTGFNREPGGTLNSMTRGGKNHYYLTDALGSVVALADEAGTKVNTYAFSPRGVQRATTSEQVPQPYRFAGGYQDPTGLYHFAARYYDPNIGRFTTPDPSGLEENPYLYAAGDPVNRIDPTGLYSVDDFKSDIGFIGSTATIGGFVGGGIGSVVPGAGTAAGTLVGGLAGTGFGIGFVVGSRL